MLKVPVTVHAIESKNATRQGQPSMRHTREFVGARSDEIISVLLGVTFSGKQGLMVDSTAEGEEDSSDGSWRVITGFRPLGGSFVSFLGGSFHVRQELIECSQRAGGAAATIPMSFLPYNEKERAPSGSCLWTVEPCGAVDQARSLWSEFINTDETERMGIPQLRIKTGLRWAFRVGHSRLIHKAASRIADVLSNRDERAIAFAD